MDTERKTEKLPSEQINRRNGTPEGTARKLGGAAVNQASNPEARRDRPAKQAVGEKAIEAARPIPTVLSLDKFDTEALRSLYPESKIKADRRYVERTKERFGYDKPTRAQRLAKDFETLVLYGIQRNGWLGNVAGKDGKVPFTTETSAATEYDDYRHRIDAFTTLKFTTARPDEEHQASLQKAILGLDATVSGKRQTIMEKLTRCHNDPETQLPFGFSKIDYYVYGRTASKQPLVPRYVIGVSGERVKDLEEMAHLERMKNGRIVNIRFNAGQSAMTRFMVLSEIRAQNELYRAMLPEKLDNNMLKKSSMILKQITLQLNAALDQCASRLSDRRWLVGDLKVKPEAERTPEEREELRTTIEQFLLEHLGEEYLEQGKEKARRENFGRLPSDYQPDPDYQDTFVQIMTCCRELTEAAKSGALDSQKPVQSHSRPFEVPRS